MDKKLIKSGDPIPPEFFNALQDLSFTKGPGEVGGLPNPPGKMEFFEAAGGGSVNVSSANGVGAVILNVGSQISTDKETLTITGCNPAMGRCPGVIFVIPRGAAYELDVVLPCTAASTETITLHAGCAGIFTFQYYQGNTNWKCCEIKPPEYDVRMKFFEAAGGGSVDVSSACDGAAMILNVGSQISTDKETLTITGCNPAMGRCPGFITVVPRGAAYELDVVLPCTAASTETITLHAGCIGIFTFQYYQGNTNWRCHEINRRDCPAFFKEISVDGIIHVSNGNDTFDIKCDMNSANAWIPELVVGDLDTYMIVSVPKLHVYKQSTFEKDVTIKADAVIEKTLTVNKSIDAEENIRTPLFVIGRNVPGELTSIGDPEPGTATYLQWQLKSEWEMNEVKKIFNDTGATVEQAVFVPDSLPRLGQPAITSRLNTIYIPARTYREFTCVGSHTQNGVEYAVLAPSSDQ
jgi:hypothetical protein